MLLSQEETKRAAIRQDSNRSFDTIMSETTRDMSRQRRFFSKFIHARGISSVSDILGSTIARPNALFFGAVSSFGLTLIAYLLSKNLGYTLSGFESIGAFLLGWTAGTLFDAVQYIFKKK